MTTGYRPIVTLSSGMRALLYILSFLIPPAGIIIGVIFYVKPDPEMKRVGRNCIIIAVIVWATVAIISIAVFALVVSLSSILSTLSGAISV